MLSALQCVCRLNRLSLPRRPGHRVNVHKAQAPSDNVDPFSYFGLDGDADRWQDIRGHDIEVHDVRISKPVRSTKSRNQSHR